MEFKVGDVVMIKSGSPNFVVLEVGDKIRCAWFDPVGKDLREISLPEKILMHKEGNK